MEIPELGKMAEKMMLTPDQALLSTDESEVRIAQGLVKSHIKVQLQTLTANLAKRTPRWKLQT